MNKVQKAHNHIQGTMKDLNRWKTLSIVALVAAIPALITLVVLLVWHPPAPQSKAQALHPAAVQIGPGGFEPATLTIKAGSTVTWEDDDEHAPTGHWVEGDPYPTPANPADLSSGRLMDEMHYAYTFAKPGTYHYHDHFYPTRSGTIIVQ